MGRGRSVRIPRTATHPHGGHGRRNRGGAPAKARRIARLKELGLYPSPEQRAAESEAAKAVVA